MDQVDPWWTKGGSCACAMTDPGTEEAFNWWKGTLEGWSQVSHVKILPRGVWTRSWRQTGSVEIYVGDQFCGTTPAEWDDLPAWQTVKCGDDVFFSEKEITLRKTDSLALSLCGIKVYGTSYNAAVYLGAVIAAQAILISNVI